MASEEDVKVLDGPDLAIEFKTRNETIMWVRIFFNVVVVVIIV